MSASNILPLRPSLDSLRKQAKKLARDVAAGDDTAIARVRAHLPRLDGPLTQRNAQLVIAREYGFAGWQDLTAEVNRRAGDGLAWATAQARRVIHDNNLDDLKQLVTDYPALLAWHADRDDGGVLGFAAGAYGDAFEPFREERFTRAACAEWLIDAGAVVTPAVCDGLLRSRARGLLRLFRRKDRLPRSLKFLAALGELDDVRAALDESASDLAAVNDAFVCASSFEHEAIGSLLLERAIALDPDLGRNIDGSPGRDAFVKYFIERRPAHAAAVGLWKAFMMDHLTHAILDRDLATFVRGLERERWLLDDAYVWFQNELFGAATLNDREDFIVSLLDLQPAILRRQPPPVSQAIEFAFTYAHTHLIPLLTRVWPLPDDLPHAAGIGNLARVKQWFDASGRPALGDLDRHYPHNDAHARAQLLWNPPTAQQVLDMALVFSVINNHFDVADFLLAHGADINTNWSSHEPASILHELTFHRNYEAMRFLIDRGIDMTIRDYRWNSTAAGWARYAEKDEQEALWLENAERERASRAGSV